jgi:hypothetical protein
MWLDESLRLGAGYGQGTGEDRRRMDPDYGRFHNVKGGGKEQAPYWHRSCGTAGTNLRNNHLDSTCGCFRYLAESDLLEIQYNSSVADPDLGSGAFLSQGSGIRNEFFRIPDLGSKHD